MYLSSVQFQSFRNFQSLDLQLDQGSIVLAGFNGAGKTNFLEGIYFGLTLMRFPGSALSQLFEMDHDFFSIVLTGQAGEEKKFEVIGENRTGRASLHLKLDGQEVSRSRFTSAAPVISFLPEDLNLMTHSPAGRRRFLDEALSAVSGEYRQALSYYQKALKQRNLALEQGTEKEIWETQLAEHGADISRKRKQFMEFVNQGLPSVLRELSPGLKHVRVVYQMRGDEQSEGFQVKLDSARARDERRFSTSVGPHLDDFEMHNEGRTVAGWVSRGQLRALTLSLKILEQQFLNESLGQKPLLLLDDVFSEFDSVHQQKVLEFLDTFEQIFLTTAHLQEIEEHLPQKKQVFIIDNGHVQPAR